MTGICIVNTNKRCVRLFVFVDLSPVLWFGEVPMIYVTRAHYACAVRRTLFALCIVAAPSCQVPRREIEFRYNMPFSILLAFKYVELRLKKFPIFPRYFFKFRYLSAIFFLPIYIDKNRYLFPIYLIYHIDKRNILTTSSLNNAAKEAL